MQGARSIASGVDTATRRGRRHTLKGADDPARSSIREQRIQSGQPPFDAGWSVGGGTSVGGGALGLAGGGKVGSVGAGTVGSVGVGAGGVMLSVGGAVSTGSGAAAGGGTSSGDGLHAVSSPAPASAMPSESARRVKDVGERFMETSKGGFNH
jgi:hypothetical protein